jgi:hypothetical protein
MVVLRNTSLVHESCGDGEVSLRVLKPQLTSRGCHLAMPVELDTGPMASEGGVGLNASICILGNRVLLDSLLKHLPMKRIQGAVMWE